jgi:hypothetical protein
MDNDQRGKCSSRLEDTRFPRLHPTKTDAQTFKGAKMSKLDVAVRVAGRTGRRPNKQRDFNWKDFRLRPTLYVRVSKKGGGARLGDVQGLWRDTILVVRFNAVRFFRS